MNSIHFNIDEHTLYRVRLIADPLTMWDNYYSVKSVATNPIHDKTPLLHSSVQLPHLSICIECRGVATF